MDKPDTKKRIMYIVMLLRSSISFTRKMFKSEMYFIRTETGTVVFQPEAFSEDGSIAETEKNRIRRDFHQVRADFYNN